MLWTSDHAVIHELYTQHPKVEQPVELLKFYDLWGTTISSVAGDEWKAHRKAVSAGFSPALNKTVWEQAQNHTDALIAHWIEKESSIVSVVRTWTSKLALHVISSGFFNYEIKWEDEGITKSLPSGHQLPFDQALFIVLKRLMTIVMTPRALLGILPGKMFRETSLGLAELSQYFREFKAGAESDVVELAEKRNKTLLGSYSRFS